MGTVLFFFAVLTFGGLLALGNAVSDLRKTVREKRGVMQDLDARAASLQKQQAATELSELRLSKLEKKLGEPLLTPLALLSDVADTIADYVEVSASTIAQTLATKQRPALRAAEEVRALSARLRAATREQRLARYKAALYEREAPWLVDLLEAEYPTLEEVQEPDAEDDPSRRFLSASEYAALSTAERSQLALDRYWHGRKSSWQVGRDFERYIGYLWEKKGYTVQYHGIEEGLQDLGRDLLARRGEELVVIQCKHWATFRTVRERHVYQLFGTALELALSQDTPPQKNRQPTLFPKLLESRSIRPLLVTSTTLSPKAKEVAGVLGVDVEESVPMEKYPCIKCNVARASGERIYHLPFDQQYDNVLIEPDRGELYVDTAAEAERRRFRRAHRWRGDAKAGETSS